MKRCIVTVKLDVTDQLPPEWENYMEDSDIKQHFRENPEDVQGKAIPTVYDQEIIIDIDRQDESQ